MTYCGLCHLCGFKLRKVLDGEEWCDNCKMYCRYRSHGWGSGGTDSACRPQHVIGADIIEGEIIESFCAVGNYALQGYYGPFRNGIEQDPVYGELARRGVLKPDNRRHTSLGKIPGAYRVSKAWINAHVKP